jgi:hypothetical protein
MGREFGRISGPLLADNLKRNGTNLAFDTQVLYFDVVNNRVGFNSNTPATDVYTPNYINTVNLIGTTTSNISNFTITTNQIQNVVSAITISPNQSGTPTIITPGLSTDNLYIYGNTISDTVTNDSINITAKGTGAINLSGNTLVNGSLTATGNVTWDGNITLGNANTDTIALAGEIKSSIVPGTSGVYALGSSSSTWANTYVTTANTTTISIGSLTVTSFIGSGTNSLNGDSVIGTNSSNTLTLNATINSNLSPAATNSYNIGSSTAYYNNLYADSLSNGIVSVKDNTVTTTVTNSNLSLSAAGTGIVIFPNLNLPNTNNINVGGTLAVTGTSTFSNNVSTGAINQTGSYTLTGNASLGNITSVTDITASEPSVFSGVQINNSVISGVQSGNNLKLTAPANKNVEITLAKFDNNISIGGTLGVTGTTSFANVNSGTINQTGSYALTGNAILGNLTSTSVTGGITSSGALTLPDVILSGTTNGVADAITGTQANTNLSFSANGTGSVEIKHPTFDSSVSVGGNLSVSGTSTFSNNVSSGSITQTGDFNQTGNVVVTGNVSTTKLINTSSIVNTPDFDFSGSTIAGTLPNAMVYYESGSGNTWLGNDLYVNGSTITNNFDYGSNRLYAESNLDTIVSESGALFTFENINPTSLNQSIVLSPTGAGNVVISGTNSVILPIGDDSTQILNSNGQVRFNDVNQNIEGYSNTGYVDFISVISQDQKTHITAELTPGAADNLLRFAINGVVTTTISSTGIQNTKLQAGNIVFTNNTISNTNSSADISLIGNGTGHVKFNGINYVNTNNFYVPSSGALTLASTNKGYVKFSGSNGIQIPTGDSSSFSNILQTGLIRYNTDNNQFEVYDGTSWLIAYGVNTPLTQAEIQNLVEVYTILLGF